MEDLEQLNLETKVNVFQLPKEILKSGSQTSEQI